MFNKPGPTVYQQHILYDMVSAYALSNNKWLSYETSETIIYKTKFAIREGLGGIGLLTLNQVGFGETSLNFYKLSFLKHSISGGLPRQLWLQKLRTFERNPRVDLSSTTELIVIIERFY